MKPHCPITATPPLPRDCPTRAMTMRRKFRLGLGIMAFSLSANAFAAAGSAPGSGLAAALEQAWQRHPEAAGLPARDAEARAVSELAASLTPEPGSVSLANLNDRINRNLGRQEWEVEFATPLWLPGQQAARQTEAARLMALATAKRAALRLTLAGDVREAWWHLAGARNAKSLQQQRLGTARALAADVTRRFEAGELSLVDANVAKAELRIAESELQDAETALLQASQALEALTGVAPPLALEAESAPLAARTHAAADALQSHPLLLAAAAAASSARAKVGVADASRRAAPEVALRLSRERADVDSPYANAIGIRLKIPFSSGPQVRRERAAADAEAEQADAQVRQSTLRVQQEIERARLGWQAAERQFAMAEDRVTLTAENLRLIEKSFALGETDLATLLRVRAAAFDASTIHDRQRVARAAAISRLNQSLGVLP